LIVTLKHIIEIMEMLAPKSLADGWDNVGVQVGHVDWPIRKILVALDPTNDVVSGAISEGADLLVTHHPLILRPLTGVNLGTPPGSTIALALESGLAIFAAHTNLDNAEGGVNSVLAQRFGLRDVTVLRARERVKEYKLVVFVPEGHEERVLDVLFRFGAGRIGAYENCSFRSRGIGTFRPGEKARPFIGEVNSITQANEYRVEARVSAQSLFKLINALQRVHPYEEMAYDIYPLHQTGAKDGLGRIGYVKQEVRLIDLARKIKETLDLDGVKIAGDPELLVKCVAVCSGSGSSLIQDFFSSDADVFVSGDLGYHDARMTEDLGKGLIDIGHFASERVIVDSLVLFLKKKIEENGWSVEIDSLKGERDPFKIIS